jgi:hypothetical protein
VTPAGTGSGSVSPDGQDIVAFGPALGHRRYALAGGTGREISGLSFNDHVIRWSPDGRALYVGRGTSFTADRVDLATGHREPFLTLAAGGRAGFPTIMATTIANDSRIYAYATAEYLSQLFTVDGVR